MVGTGPAQEELEGLAERLGIAGRVTWLGALPRAAVDEVWPRLDVVVVPSRNTPRWVEATPRAALDAMAHGIAVVGSTGGALPETIADAGLVVPEEDVPALSETLQRLHDDPEEVQRLGLAGRRRAMDRLQRRRRRRANARLLARPPSRNRLTSPYLRAIFALHAHLGIT